MPRRTCERVLWLVLVAASMLAVLPSGLVASPVCGNQEHWVNSCPPGQDVFSSVASVTVQDDPLNPTWTITVDLSDPATTIYRGQGAGDTIQTEIVSLSLTGSGVVVHAGDGVGNLQGDGPTYSPGMVQTQVGDPFIADSFFDVFFEVTIPGPFPTLHNYATDPGQHLRMQTVLTEIPPMAGTIYEPPIPYPIPLYVNGYPEPVAWLTHASHTVTPEPGTIVFLGAGLAAVGFAAWRRNRN